MDYYLKGGQFSWNSSPQNLRFIGGFSKLRNHCSGTLEMLIGDEPELKSKSWRAKGRWERVACPKDDRENMTVNWFRIPSVLLQWRHSSGACSCHKNYAPGLKGLGLFTDGLAMFDCFLNGCVLLINVTDQRRRNPWRKETGRERCRTTLISSCRRRSWLLIPVQGLESKLIIRQLSGQQSRKPS